MSLLLARLERVPFSRPHYRLLAMGGLGLTFDGLVVAMLAFALPVVSAQWNLSGAQAGLIGSSTLIGFLIGAIGAGILGDRIGRRRIMMYGLAVYGVSTLLAAAAPSWEVFFVLRLIAGVGTGGESVIIPSLLSELVPGRLRGRFIGTLAGFLSFGYVIAAILGRLVVPINDHGWRIMHVLCAIPLVMLPWWRRSVPESPRFLLSQGRCDEARLVIESIEASAERALGRALPPVEEQFHATAKIIGPRMGTIEGLQALYKRGMAGRTATLWTLWFVITFSFYGFFTFMPTLLVAGGMTVVKSFSYSIIIYLAQIPGCYSSALLNDYLDRKWTIASYLSGGAVSAYLLSQSGTTATTVVFGAMLSFFMNGVYAAIYAYTPEVYPTAIRARGIGAASGFGRLGGISAPLIIGATYPVIGFTGIFLLTTSALLLGALAIAVFGDSTKRRTLEEITESAE